jgi:hypothetical protein
MDTCTGDFFFRRHAQLPGFPELGKRDDDAVACRAMPWLTMATRRPWRRHGLPWGVDLLHCTALHGIARHSTYRPIAVQNYWSKSFQAANVFIDTPILLLRVHPFYSLYGSCIMSFFFAGSPASTITCRRVLTFFDTEEGKIKTLDDAEISRRSRRKPVHPRDKAVKDG